MPKNVIEHLQQLAREAEHRKDEPTELPILKAARRANRKPCDKETIPLLPLKIAQRKETQQHNKRQK